LVKVLFLFCFWSLVRWFEGYYTIVTENCRAVWSWRKIVFSGVSCVSICSIKWWGFWMQQQEVHYAQ
jgi:hypothetical protein